MRCLKLLGAAALLVGCCDGADLQALQSKQGQAYYGVGKVKLSLDSRRYRSSSQGPVMEEELKQLGMIANNLEIDKVIDRSTRTHGWAPVIPQYSGTRSWAWHQWTGTIFERLWKSMAWNMLMPAALIAVVKLLDPSYRWWHVPDEAHPLIRPLMAVTHGWNYLLTLTTFVTTFFVGQGHTFWRKSYALTRVVHDGTGWHLISP